MANEYDSKLLEAAAVRHQRLDEALVFGANPYERKWNNVVMRVMYSLLIAALIAAICVGYSFVQHLLAQQRNTATGAAVERVLPIDQAPPQMHGVTL